MNTRNYLENTKSVKQLKVFKFQNLKIKVWKNYLVKVVLFFFLFFAIFFVSFVNQKKRR